MDVSPIILICSVFVIATMSQTTENDTTSTSTISPIVTTAAPVNCISAHALQGVCIARTLCEYGTAAIDFTLYKPSWYRSPCATDEVCCPFDSLIVEKSETDNSETNLNNLYKDDDDKFY